MQLRVEKILHVEQSQYQDVSISRDVFIYCTFFMGVPRHRDLSKKKSFILLTIFFLTGAVVQKHRLW
jgi:hypothetical protein